MPLGYPLIVVTGSKGGVGTTTLTAGLLHAARELKIRLAMVDLTWSNDASRVLERRAVALSSLVRHRGRMPALVDRALQRNTVLLALDLEASMYAERLTEVLRVLATRRPVVVDAGSAFATAGARPLTPYLSLATYIALVLVPDVRSIARTERLLESWAAHRDKVVVVENMAGDSLAVSGAAPVPTASSGDLGRLMKEPAGDAIRALARRLFSQQVAEPEAISRGAPPDRGIVRSILAGRRAAGE